MVRVELIPEALRIGSGAPFDFYFWGRLAPPPRGSWAYWVSTWAKCVVALARPGISLYAIHSLPERENKLHLIIFLVLRINPAFPAFELIRRIFRANVQPSPLLHYLLPRWVLLSPSSGTSTQSNSRTRRRRGWTRRWRVIEYSSILHRRQSWTAGGTNDGFGRIAVVRGRGGPAPYLG